MSNKKLIRSNNSLIPSIFRDGISFDNIFDDILNEWNLNRTDWIGPIPVPGRSYPKFNIIDNKENYMIEVSVPGVTKNDIKIDLNNSILSIMANRTETQKNEDNRYICRELKQSSWKRSIDIGDNVDVNQITSKIENGILTINLPKKNKDDNSLHKEIKIE